MVVDNDLARQEWFKRYRDYERLCWDADKLPAGSDRIAAFASLNQEHTKLWADPSRPQAVPVDEVANARDDFHAALVFKGNTPDCRMFRQWHANGCVGDPPASDDSELNKLAQRIVDWRRLELQRAEESAGDGLLASGTTAEPIQAAAEVKRKRSTGKEDADKKLRAALTNHHQYADGGCLNTEPIGVNALARKASTPTAKVSNSSASRFFERHFAGDDEGTGQAKYQRACADGRLIYVLQTLNGELAAHLLLTSTSPGDRE